MQCYVVPGRTLLRGGPAGQLRAQRQRHVCPQYVPVRRTRVVVAETPSRRHTCIIMRAREASVVHSYIWRRKRVEWAGIGGEKVDEVEVVQHVCYQRAMLPGACQPIGCGRKTSGAETAKVHRILPGIRLLQY